MTTAVKEHGMIFSGPLIPRLLDGTKSQTRRIVSAHNSTVLGYPAKSYWPHLLFEHARKSNKATLSVPFRDPDFMSTEAVDDLPQYRVRPVYEIGMRLWPAMRIPGLDDRYCADTTGAIWTCCKLNSWRRLKASPNKKGYLTVTPAANGKYQGQHVHALVAKAFYPDRLTEHTEVRHLDGNPQNNAPDNLDWGTPSQNWADRNAHGRCKGVEHFASKLTLEAVEIIRSDTASNRALAARFGVAQATISAVRRGHTWRTNDVAAPPNYPRWASRLTLEITKVRVERVSHITAADAWAEGIRPDGVSEIAGDGTLDDVPPDAATIEGFRELWNQIHGDGAFERNDLVWCLSFKRVE